MGESLPQLMDQVRKDPGIVLLAVLLVLFVFFLPSILAFQRGHRRFWPILGINVVQGMTPSSLLQGPALAAPIAVWAALLFWATRSVPDPDPRLTGFRNTKLFDVLAGLPLVLWFATSAWQLRATLAYDGGVIASGEAELTTWLRFFSVLFSILFNLLTIWLLLVRDRPVRRIGGALPRICAVAGTFLGVGILHLPVAELSLPVQALAFLLTGFGSAASFAVLWRLGKSFSIVPEARRLVTAGPYALARHPLYAMEIVTVLGLSIQYRQPWAALLGLAVMALQVTRSVFEERVLSEAFPEYADYRGRVKRFGVI
jgi:protein-S-isoprenylcysteine O-methyltransferase Ste14